MFNFKHLLRGVMLALVLAGSSAAAVADPVPTHHVSIDTSAFSGGGFIDFTFLSFGDAAPATVTLSNFTGAFGGVLESEGAVDASTAGVLVLSNLAGHTAVFQALALGGSFGFDLTFGGSLVGSAGEAGASFGIGLFDANEQYLGNPDGNLLQFELGALGAPTPGLTVTANSGLATVSAVPKPSELAMLLAGIALVGFCSRRHRSATFS